MIKHALTVVLVLALAACGFHLRDALQLPPDLGPVRVVAKDAYSPLAQSLADALQRAGATPAAADATDVATLEIVSERWRNTALSVDSLGRAEEYTLRYAVFFRLLRADGSALVPLQSQELSRDYVSVATRSAGTDSEREILTKELRKDMVSSVLRRIDAVVRMPATAPAGVPDSTPDSGS